MNKEWSYIADCISEETESKTHLNNPQSISGGCINQAWKVTDQNNQTWFVKINKPSRVSMFEAESEGLQDILDTNTIYAPKPLCSGQTTQHSFLVMEYLKLRGSPNAEEVGRQLAKMHRHTQDAFGWKRDNTIGSTPQINTPDTNWVSFWKQQRLQFQLNLALRNGLAHHSYDQGMELSDQLDPFFTSYQPAASLLHGDLWGGNCSADNQGKPVIYDPAVYFGDRETDLAMTELFGGFGNSFMQSYHEAFPIDSGYPVRKTLYNLYHILNHYNLFGSGYASQAASMIHSLLSELR